MPDLVGFTASAALVVTRHGGQRKSGFQKSEVDVQAAIAVDLVWRPGRRWAENLAR